jgi:hypothetical protein
VVREIRSPVNVPGRQRIRRLALCLALLAITAFVVCPAIEAADSALKGAELLVMSGDMKGKLREGDKVGVTFEEKDGQKVVSSVEVTGQ